MANKIMSRLRAKVIEWLGGDRPGASAVPFNSIANVMNCYKTGSYDNNFPNITRIAETFAEVEPFAIDANGKRLKKTPHLLDVLYNPNEQMSGSDFWETLIVMMLVHPIVYLLVWHHEGEEIVPGGPITDKNIAGLTFMEGVGVATTEGKTTYYHNGKTYGKKDVIALSLNVNPYNLLAGYSPSLAAKKWATADDYIAEYQIAHFRNGAIPAGEFVITASSTKEFDQIVDHMQAAHRGPANANNVQYVHRPTSSIDGKPMSAQVEWVPFAQPTNKDTLQSIFDQANKKLDMDFGVPQEVKGYLQNSNYASAEVAEFIFSRYVVYPKLKKVYSKMNHELNRLTGGHGFALSFDYELPVMTDTRKVQADTLISMVNAGFTVKSVVAALKLPQSFTNLIPSKTSSAPAQSDTPQVESPSQVSTTTDAQDSSKSLKRKEADVDVSTDQIWKQNLNPELVKILKNYLDSIIDKAIELINENPEQNLSLRDAIKIWLRDSGLNDKTVTMIISVLAYLMLQKGQVAIEGFGQTLGVEDLSMELSEEDYRKLQSRIKDLIQKFGEDTADNLAQRYEQNADLDTDEAIATLALLKSSEEYRVTRWVASEQHESEELAVIIAAVIASRETGTSAKKTWRINPLSPDICAFCVRMNGETVEINQPFSNGQMVPHYHPHCYCTMEITFDTTSKSIKITCPDCGRYMMESTGGTMKNVICANSKCKKHFDIEVKGGKVKATERKNHE